MMPQPEAAQPPPVAVWLVTLFAPFAESESILGDLQEEFHLLAAKSGAASARRWYWRQTASTISHLAAAAFRTAPWTLSAIVIGGFLLRWFISRWSDPSVHRAIDAFLDTYRLHEHDPAAYVFWVTNGMLIFRLLVNALIGALVALVAKGREMPAAIALAFLGDVLAIHAVLSTVARTGDHGVLGTLPHTFAFSAAIVAAAAIVRTRRSAQAVTPL